MKAGDDLAAMPPSPVERPLSADDAGRLRNPIILVSLHPASWRAKKSKSHAVQFYNDDVFLIGAVCSFIKTGLEEGATIIVVTTEKHREELRNAFQDVGDHGIEEKMVYLDATELSSAFMIDDWPNQTRFASTVGHMVQQAALAGPVRIFGEMVLVLWAEWNTRAAIRLEEVGAERVTNIKSHHVSHRGGYARLDDMPSATFILGESFCLTEK